jgi:hypothetical protein
MLSKARHAGQTTLGAAGGKDSEAPGDALGLRWLFPATDGPVTPLMARRLVLGRGDDCGTVLPGAEISRYHAEIIQNGPLAILRDLDSKNGSFVNGRPARETPLGPGDVVRLGEWVGVVMADGAEGSGPRHWGTIVPGLYGGPRLQQAVAPALRAAKSDLPVIIEGETGTGKELVARAIHVESGRRGAFLALNCAALPEGLVEGELFGYRRGAFTGADRANPGHFRAADGGTLLFDEVCELALPLQAKILRVIEQREVLSLGESQAVRVDTRVLVAAQSSLEQAVAAGSFRADLHARLDGVTVRLPPLRERIEDVPYLFARFLHESSGGHPPGVDPLLVERLCLYDWPLNVRELLTLVRRLLVLYGHERSLKLDFLPSRLRGLPAGAARSEPLDQDERDDADYARLVEALRGHAGNVSRAATAVGISRQRAYRLMQARPELGPDDFRANPSKPDEGAQ